MTTRFHIGAKELKGSVAAYAKRFGLLEVKADARAPTIAALRKWRKAVPPNFEFTIIAGPKLAQLKASAALDEELALAKQMIDTLQARFFLLQTPADVTPGAVWRDRLGQLLERLPRDVTQIGWEPRGVWETDDAALAAKRWGIVLVVDAAREAVPAGPVAYVRLRAMGETRSFGESALARVVENIGTRRDAYVILETSSALAECKQLRRLAQHPTGRFEGGMGRVVRPRGLSVKVRDDEQE